jgi:hypothetical protein
MSCDPFADVLGTRRGSDGAKVAAPRAAPIVRARALGELLAASAGDESPAAASPVAAVEALLDAHGLSSQVLATRSFADGAAIVFELRDVREDWSALLTWRAPRAWKLYTRDAGTA